MAIRVRILVFQLVIAGCALAAAGAVWLTVHGTDRFLRRTDGNRQQLDAITTIALHINRYSEQIAEVLLVGDAEKPDFEAARREIGEAFERLGMSTRGETAVVAGKSPGSAGTREIQRFTRLLDLFHDIDHAAEQVFLLRDRGEIPAAIDLFRSSIEDHLDVEMGMLLAAAIAEERREVEETTRSAERLRRRLVTLAGAVAGLAIISAAVGGTILGRSIVRPVLRLAAGAEAIARGDLSHRIREASGNDELARLSQRFNDMVTALAQQRRSLLAAQNRLERAVEERTAELQDANRRLQEVDQIRGQFLADISHELRTPLTVLRGEAEVALRSADRATVQQQRAALERVLEEAVELGRLIDDLLLLARAEAGIVHFEQQRAALQDVVMSATPEANLLARRKGIRLSLDLPLDPILVSADSQRLKQAILIAVDNGVKYSAPGSEVRIAAAATGGVAEIIVADQGQGIPAEERQRVFDRFYRGSAARNRGISGTGLGLSIARWIVEKHGGEILLEDAVPGGTILTIRLQALPG